MTHHETARHLAKILSMALVLAGALAALIAVDPPAPKPAGASSSLPLAGKTGAPGESFCTECHQTNALNSGDGLLEILGVPAMYTPGQVYHLGIRLRDPLQQRWGFEMTPVRDSDGLAAGTLTSLDDLTFVQDFSGRTYVSHVTFNGADGTFFGTANGPVTWSFDWTAPGSGAGGVTFYAVGNAANGNGNNTGDFIYSITAKSAEETASAVETTTWGHIKRIYR